MFAEVSGVLHHFWVEGSLVHEGAKTAIGEQSDDHRCYCVEGRDPGAG